MTMQCAHRSLDDWGSTRYAFCPDCGQMVDVEKEVPHIGPTVDEREQELQEAYEEGAEGARDSHIDEGMNIAYERVADETNLLVCKLLDLLADDVDNDEPVDWQSVVDEVQSSLDGRGWE